MSSSARSANHIPVIKYQPPSEKATPTINNKPYSRAVAEVKGTNPNKEHAKTSGATENSNSNPFFFPLFATNLRHAKRNNMTQTSNVTPARAYWMNPKARTISV